MTAVEFLHSKYMKIFGEMNPSTGKLVEIAYAIEQAKDMEKQEEQEKIDFADKYGTYLLQGGIMSAAAYNETFKSEQTEDTLKLVLNDIKNTPEDVFNKQWASIKKPRTK